MTATKTARKTDKAHKTPKTGSSSGPSGPGGAPGEHPPAHRLVVGSVEPCPHDPRMTVVDAITGQRTCQCGAVLT
jgi:hypothetical protein